MARLPDDNTPDLPQLIRDSWAKGSPTDWFEALYASAATGQMRVPWAQMQPNAELLEWLAAQPPLQTGAGRAALVVGCGLGDDAEALAEQGFDVVAFDVSPTAIDWCRRRFAASPVTYEVADLLSPPPAWQQAFDFVLESRTVQALPYNLHPQAAGHIGGFVKAGGALLVLCHGRDAQEEAKGIPWPLSTKELAAFEQGGLEVVSFEDYSKNGLRRFRVHYRKSAGLPK